MFVVIQPPHRMKEGAVLRSGLASWRAILAAAAVTACSAHAASDGGDAGGPSADRFAISFAQAFCESIGPCCMASGVTFDESRCVAAATTLVGFELTSPAIANG